MSKMRKKKGKKVLPCMLATTMLLGSVNLLEVLATDSIPMTGEQARKTNQPRFNGYRIWDIRDWTPEADEGSEFLVAKVPLQKRNKEYKPTQVNPNLDSNGQIMLMQGDYGNSFVDGMMYNNTFGYHTLNYWQYVDYFSPWHGAASQDSPVSLYDWEYENKEASRGWEKRYFEFGVLNIPNPAYTNAAHKNGVMSIACLYFDQYYRPGQTINELFVMDEDGTFPVAEKLIEMAEYFGYDGYFFNAEEAVYPEYSERKKKFLARLEEAGLYTQYYDTNSYMNESKAGWLESEIDGVPTKIQDSVFVNYGWPGSFDSQLEWMKENNIDPYEQAFYGIECLQGKFNGGHGTSSRIEELYTNDDGTKNLKSSVALFTPSDFYQRDLDDGKLQNTNYQWMIAERERMFFSGVKSDPTNTGDQKGYGRPDVQVDDAGNWPGVADFSAERSVIDGTTFYSNFNVGKGVQYFVNGEVSSDEEWSNINIQDILPTWQWWIDSEGDSKLSADFDYGSKEVRKDVSGKDMTLPYTQVGAYEGGSSLVVYGDVDAKNKLHLFKTDLEVKDSSKASITFRKTSNDDVSMKLGVILKDGESTSMEELEIADSTAKGGWITSEVDLSQYAGKNIAALGLVFDGQAKGYQMNIGGIKVTDGGNYTPAAPTNFGVDRNFVDDEMIVTWDLGNFDTVDKYEIYANLSNGEKVFVGGIFDNVYYIKNLKETNAVTLELVAVGKDGSRSEAAKYKVDYNKSVKDLAVASEEKEISVHDTAVVKGKLVQSKEEGALNLSWTNPSVDYDHLEIEVTMDDSADTEAWTMTVPKGQSEARIEVPRYNGEQYNVAVTVVFANGSKGEPVNVTGKVKDTYSMPFTYDGENIRIEGTRLTAWCPQSPDWFKLHISLDGEYVQFRNGFNAFTAPHAIRAATTMKASSALPATEGMLEVVVEDYAGNMSEPCRMYLKNGVLTNKQKLNALIAEAEALDFTQYTESTVEPVKAALEEAKAVQEKDKAEQTEIDAAAEKLSKAMEGLEKKNGWVETEKGWMYYEDGEKAIGWKDLSGTWYYFNKDGIMETGWVSVGGHWYYLNTDGSMETGWLQLEDTWYYLNADGVMETGWVQVGNTWYHLDNSGVMETGWVSVGGHWYYLNTDGAMKTGWVLVEGHWYYLNEDGVMETGWVQVGNTWYHLDNSGVMETGWVSVGGHWYYLNTDGSMETGWVQVGSDWYYMNTDGTMATSKWIDGCYVDASGKMA